MLEVRLFLEELPHPAAGDRRTENAPALPKHLHNVLIGTLQRGALGRIAAATGRRRVLGTIDAHQRRRIDLVRGDGDADAVRKLYHALLLQVGEPHVALEQIVL